MRLFFTLLFSTLLVTPSFSHDLDTKILSQLCDSGIFVNKTTSRADYRACLSEVLAFLEQELERKNIKILREAKEKDDEYKNNLEFKKLKIQPKFFYYQKQSNESFANYLKKECAKVGYAIEGNANSNYILNCKINLISERLDN